MPLCVTKKLHGNVRQGGETHKQPRGPQLCCAVMSVLDCVYSPHNSLENRLCF